MPRASIGEIQNIVLQYASEAKQAGAWSATTETITGLLNKIAKTVQIDGLFEDYCVDVVVNLGAQAGVRYSIINPQAYIDSNMTGFFNILEACRHSYDGGKKGVQHLVYASSSSVYGTNKKVPYRNFFLRNVKHFSHKNLHCLRFYYYFIFFANFPIDQQSLKILVLNLLQYMTE